MSWHRVGRMLALLVVCALSASSNVHASATVFGGVTRTFPYRQKKLLFSRQGPGALVHVPDGTADGATLPVLVFLHGQNAEQHMHPRFDGTSGDLRKLANDLLLQGKTRPFLIAAPTHTRYATGSTVMWPTFEIGHFLDATDAELGSRAKTERGHVVVVGHSAAGCNPTTGIFAAASLPSVRAVVSVDTCLTEPIRDAYLALAPKTDLRVFWNSAWPGRPFADLANECRNPNHPCRVTEVANLSPSEGAPHDAILGEALRRVLPELFPPPAAPAPPPKPVESHPSLSEGSRRGQEAHDAR
jgi:hypothetical protein